ALDNKKLIWHFIGRLQSKKTPLVAKHFAWVHSVDRYLIAERLNQQRPAGLAPLNVCLQVNISNEPNKAGIKAAELVDLALKVNTLEHLKLRGLMAIPAPESDFNRQLEAFTKLHELSQILSFKGLKLDTLSMGMSNDFIAAIAAGSTMLRIGTAIFGHRDKVN
nr:YggS family pyridoxal phosphate-dependent enzyme [Gammaproteobacteria bacterium]